ncbi:hypothetical protein ACFSPU_01480 [Haoranjiania flava]|uniref:Uncharacterized protein n=1 Tax=Haoranjiania flava TaxID=1856322 RepID=A0AAE3IJ15_9BACT|nr:hypothetical protein [Haoranjiania flava]MCU7692905.1 hypothetical protein [Haoranjiania flava]
MKIRLITIFIFFTYCAFLIKVMVFKDVPFIRIGWMMIYFGAWQTDPANLILFKTILIYLPGGKGFIIGGINLIGNTVLVIPVGLRSPIKITDRTTIRNSAGAISASGLKIGNRVTIVIFNQIKTGRKFQPPF